jgi:CheY-like chemotaxis protein
MSGSHKNLLIVEDAQEWCDAYTRAAIRENFPIIKVAKHLKEAESYIGDMQFAVAFVDIGLNEADDRNVDGLQVMEKIRKAGDKTSIIVVTGRSGQDVLPITRDSIFKYQVHNIMRKADIEPSEIRGFLKAGLEAFEKATAGSELTPQDALRGSLPGSIWDEHVMRAIGARSGVQPFYGFLKDLVSGLLPLVPPKGDTALEIDKEAGLVHGRYWTRATGQAVLICCGQASAVSAEKEQAASDGLVLGRYHVGTILSEASSGGVAGAVFELTGTPRTDFGTE